MIPTPFSPLDAPPPGSQATGARRGTARCGFSFIELIVVVLILAVVTAIASPRLSASLARVRLEAVAKQLQSDLELARRTAINRGRVVQVTFDLAQRRYACPDVPAPHCPGGTLAVPLDQFSGEPFTLLADFDADTGITFEPQGGLRMVDLTGESVSTGLLRVQSGEHDLRIEIRPRLSVVTWGPW